VPKTQKPPKKVVLMFCGDAAGVLTPSLGFACFAGQLKLSKNVPDVFVERRVQIGQGAKNTKTT
jgi:hypothetical protein